jgi:hypothetical protein
MINKDSNVYVNMIEPTLTLDDVLENYKHQPINRKNLYELFNYIKLYTSEENIYCLFTYIDNNLNIGYDDYNEYIKSLKKVPSPKVLSPEEYFLDKNRYNINTTQFMLERSNNGN